MHGTLPAVAALVLGLAVATPATLAAQLQLPEGVTARLSGRLHIQFNTTSVDAVGGEPIPASEVLIRRARLTFDVRLSDLISARIEPDYGTGGSFSLRDAWVRFGFDPAFRATVGQFKRPFDLFELTSSSQLLVIERAGAIRGVEACGPLEAVCSLSTLTEDLEFADRDLGLLLDGAVADDRVRYAVAVTNGAGLNTREEGEGNKQFTARLAVVPVRDVVVGVNASRKDYLHPLSDTDRFAMAWGADVEVGNFAGGPHLQAGLVAGENWTIGTSPTDVANFLAGQIIVTYRAGVGHRHIRGIEPVMRVSWGNPDTDVADDGGWLATPGVIVHLGGRTSWHLNLDRWMPETGPNETSFKTQLFFYF
jgi:hypothetical protein